MANSKSGNTPLNSPTKVTPQRSTTNQTKHSGPVYFSDSLFRNKHLKQKRLKWQLVISKTSKPIKRKNSKKTDNNRRHGKFNLQALPPEVTINLLSDDDEEAEANQKQQALTSSSNIKQQQPSSLPPIIVFPGHMQLSKVPNITLIPVQQVPLGMASSLQNRMRRKRKSQKPKRHAEPTIVNNESIVLSDDSNEAEAEPSARVEAPAACSTPNHEETMISPNPICPPPLSYFNASHMPNNNHHNEDADLKICSVQSVVSAPRSVQVDEEVTVSLVPRSAAGSCSSKGSNATELFPIVPDETTVQTIISNRIYELSLSKLREGLATSGVGEFADEQQNPVPTTGTRRKGTTFNLPPKLKQPNLQPVSLKLSSDLSISLISDDEDDQQQQRLNAEKLLRQQPHLSVRPVGIVTMRQPPKRRKLG